MKIEDKIGALVSRYVFQDTASTKLANFIISRYNKKARVIHNLHYLDKLWNELEGHSKEFKNKDDLLLALCFSKISASLFKANHLKGCLRRTEGLLGSLSIGRVQLDHIKKLISAATEPWRFADESDQDLLLFKDIMLKRLATNAADYKSYTDGIRAESAFVSSSVWNSKRTKRLEELLAMKTIFSTSDFEKYESSARQNLQRELEIHRLKT